VPAVSHTRGREKVRTARHLLRIWIVALITINTKFYSGLNMPPKQKSFCDSCFGRWDRTEFWHSCPPNAEASEEKWGHVLLRKFGEIEENGQCSFCRLIYNALTKHSRRLIPKDTNVYFSKVLFGEYESRSTVPRNHGTTSQIGGLEETAWQRHFVNRLCVSTFPSLTNIAKDDVWLTRVETRSGTYDECHIALLREDADNHRFFHGRRMNSTFNTSLVKQWIETCNTAHVAQCSLPRVTKRPLRVINIKEKRIEYTPSSCSYIALSYRWPTFAGLKLTSANEDSLMENGGLAHIDGILPIVEDAMTLLETLGQTYLWVDALCIPQEDGDPQTRLEGERKDQLAAMTDIYYGADLTIVACSDPDLNKGLAGIRGCTRHSQRRRDTGDLTFAIPLPNLVEAVENSPWNSRVWTFQEAARSRRLLIFTDHQIFFHCNGAMWSEDTFLEIPESQEIRVIDRPPSQAPYWRCPFPGQQLEFRSWVNAVENYTTRNVTQETDFTLGLEFIKPENRAFCHLPEKYLALALCFETMGGRRRTLNSPTWCWCHWKVPDGIKYDLVAPLLEDSAGEFRSRPFYKIGYDSTEHSLFPILIDDVQFPSLPNATGVSSIEKRFEIPNLIGFRAHTLEGRLSLGEDGLGGVYTIQFPLLNPVRASAILAVDVGKNEGDLVTCVDVLFDSVAEYVLLLVVEIDGLKSRRIGTATINLTDWKLVVGSSEEEFIFLG
jgi:hypothetical protein